MNCRETEASLLGAPNADSVERHAHIAACAKCRRLAMELLRLDRAIRCAASAVRAPEGLWARVLLRRQRGGGRDRMSSSVPRFR